MNRGDELEKTGDEEGGQWSALGQRRERMGRGSVTERKR